MRMTNELVLWKMAKESYEKIPELEKRLKALEEVIAKPRKPGRPRKEHATND